MASGYEKMDCGVTDPNLGWDGTNPTPVADAVFMVIAFVIAALQLWGIFQGVRFILGF